MFHLIILLMIPNLNAEDEEQFKFYEEEEKYTGFTCGTTEYSDWPCLDEKGCLTIENSDSW